jgi:hypothetical protein
MATETFPQTNEYRVTFKLLARWIYERIWLQDRNAVGLRERIQEALAFLQKAQTQSNDDERAFIIDGTPVAYHMAYDALQALEKTQGARSNRAVNQKLLDAYANRLRMVLAYLDVGVNNSVSNEEFDEIAAFFQKVAELEI